MLIAGEFIRLLIRIWNNIRLKMSDMALEEICITGSRPPYRKPAWIIGEVANELRAQTSPGRLRETDETKTKSRPKSTPCRLKVSFKSNQSPRCTRYGQVYSATSRKSLENAPAEESAIVLSPGYVLSRSKEKINITINTDDFFNNEQKEDNQRRKKSKPPDGRDIRINQLVTKVDDLTLLLEEERLNHKFQTKRNHDENLVLVDQIHREHREHIESIECDHEDEIEKVKKYFEQRIKDEQLVADAEKARIQSELDTLQGAFEAYKDIVATEMDSKWQRRERELKHDCEIKTEEATSELRKELTHDKNKEIDTINKEHQRQIQILVEDHAKEVDRLMEKFAECIQDSENLKKVLTQMQTMTQENADLKEKLKDVSEKYKKTQTELENKKVKLAGYEEHFAEKVAEVDNKYSMRMHGLMSDNTDLRHHYMKKCEEVLRLQSKEENKQVGSLRTAKDTMQAIIMARTRSNVSLAALRVDPTNHPPAVIRETSKKGTTKLNRRHSLPTTQDEVTAALRQTTVVETPHPRPSTPTLAELGSSHPRQRPQTSIHLNAKQTSPKAVPCSAPIGNRQRLHPAQINISEQGIEKLTPR